MNAAAYFEIFKYILMIATLIALVMAFLQTYYGKEEKTI